MNAIPVVIIGAGGFGREVHDVIEAINDAHGAAAGQKVEPLGYLDDHPADESLLAGRGVRVIGPVQRLESLAADVQYVIAIGDGETRRRIDTWATASGRISPVLVHPRASVGRHLVSLAPGAIVCAGAAITTNVRVGRHAHLNLGATVGHDAVLGDYVTVNPNASVSGSVVLGESVTLGTCSCVIQGKRVGPRTVVGAGAVVVRDLPADVTAVGIPATPRGRATSL